MGLGLGEAVGSKQRHQLVHGLLEGPLDGRVSQSSREAMPQLLRVTCNHVKQLRQLPRNHAGEDFRGQDRLEAGLRAFLSSLLFVRGLVEGRSILRLRAGIAEDVVPAGLSCVHSETLDPMPQRAKPSSTKAFRNQGNPGVGLTSQQGNAERALRLEELALALALAFASAENKAPDSLLAHQKTSTEYKLRSQPLWLVPDSG